ALPGVTCLGRDHYLGVPAVHRTEPRGRSWWCVPMDTPGKLCDPASVRELVSFGLDRQGGTEQGA
ncbi:hypothetical protein ACSNOF_21180, partial [Streptomyces sp. URMC 125]